MAKRRIGPFELEKRLGVGGMGIVYLATHLKSGQKMALKVLAPELSANAQLLKRFEREMEILQRLRHKNIVRYFGGGREGTQHYYAMEYMDGGSMEKILKRKGRLSWEQSIECGRKIAQALEHAHRYGIIHRDLKPANLFLTRSGRLKLGDFGIARDTEATALTRAGRTVGTYAYMAPEQISGKHPITGKTDLYALGCVLFEMLTGRPPFQGENQAEMLYLHLESDPPRVSETAVDCPVWLESVIDKLLEKNPDDRYYDALAAQVALEEVGEKVAQHASVAKETVAGGGSTKTVQDDRSELDRILGKKKKRRRKKKKFVPIYERTWFLATCLLLVVLGVVWTVRPLSEEQLFARARPLMETDDPDQWREARHRYLDPYLAEFPNGKYADKVREYVDKLEMEEAEGRAMTAAKFGREPKSEAERLFIEAWRFERIGDRISAYERYRGIVEIFQNSEDENDRPFVNLARRQMSKIGELDGADNRVQVVNDALRRAEENYVKGEVFQARSIWESIVTLYGTNLEFQPQVKYCRARLAGQQVESFDFARVEEPASEETGDDPEETADRGDGDRQQNSSQDHESTNK